MEEKRPVVLYVFAAAFGAGGLIFVVGGLSVLIRGLKTYHLIDGAVGLVLAIVGALLIRWVVMGVWGAKPVVATREPNVLEPVRETASRPFLVVFIFVVCAFAAGAFIYGAATADVDDGSSANLRYFAWAFSITTLFVGALGGYHLLGLLNPKPEISLEPGTPMPGDTLLFRWRFIGRTDRLERIILSLDCIDLDQESGQNTPYLNGTVLVSLPLIDSDEPEAFLSGECTVVLPEDAPPSQFTKDGKIFWQVRVRSQTRGLPNMRDYLSVTVLAADELVPA